MKKVNIIRMVNIITGEAVIEIIRAMDTVIRIVAGGIIEAVDAKGVNLKLIMYKNGGVYASPFYFIEKG